MGDRNARSAEAILMSQTLFAGKAPVVDQTAKKIQHLRSLGVTIVALCDESQSMIKKFSDVLSTEPQIALVHLGTSYSEIADEVSRNVPDVVVATHSALSVGDYHAIGRIRRTSPDIKIVSSRTPVDAVIARKLFALEVDAVLGQEAASGEYSVAIRAVGFGGLYVSRGVAEAMALSGSPPAADQAQAAAADDAGSSATDNPFGLSQREVEVLHLVAKGLSSKQIAPIVGISARTVEAHRANIRRKTKAMGLSDLVEISLRLES